MKFFDDVFDVVELPPVGVIPREVFVKSFPIDLVFESALRLLESEDVVYDLFFQVVNHC